MNTIKIGIMSRKGFRQYTIDIAKGKVKPFADAPKVTFGFTPSCRSRKLLTREEKIVSRSRIIYICFTLFF